MLWPTGGAQTDIPNLHHDCIDQPTQTIRYQRKKMRSRNAGHCCVPIGPEIQALLTRLPLEGWFSQLFDWKLPVREHSNSSGFVLGFQDVTLHSYRYAVSSHWFGILIVPLAEQKLSLNIDRVSPLQEVAKLKIPIYLIGGGSDMLAPPSAITALYNAVPKEKTMWLVKWAGHGDFFSYAETEYQQLVGTISHEAFHVAAGSWVWSRLQRSDV